MPKKTSASKTGKAFIDTGSAVEITVHVDDTQRGDLPVIVEWPLVLLRFASLVDVRKAFMPLAQFSQVQQGVKDLVERCLDELGVEQVKSY